MDFPYLCSNTVVLLLRGMTLEVSNARFSVSAYGRSVEFEHISLFMLVSLMEDIKMLNVFPCMY